MTKNKNNSLSDLNEFLKYTESSRTKPSTKRAEHTSFGRNGTSSKPSSQSFSSKDSLPNLSEINPFAALNSPNEKLSEDSIMDYINKLAEKEGISPDRVLANLMKRNSASSSYQSFLLTDMMVKGSFLMFNFFLLMKEAQGNLVADEEVSTENKK